MNSVFDIICALSRHPAVSGKESAFSACIENLQTDDLGNVWWIKKAGAKNPKTILIEAHRDEIGLCVSGILENGFLSVSPCGGIDPNNLPGTQFTVAGQQRIRAVAVSTPPHLAGQGEKKEKLSFDDLYLDTGIADTRRLKKQISVGDPIFFSTEPKQIANGKILARSLDNKVSIASLILASDMIKNSKNNIIFLLSVGEETTSCGVRSFCRKFCPDVALVVDAGFAFAPGLDRSRCILANEGPSVSVTDTLSADATRWVQNTAKEHGLSLQVIAEPGGTGTSASAIQTEGSGIPSAVISIPVFNMHTPSEIVSEEDVARTATLLHALSQSNTIPEREVTLLG